MGRPDIAGGVADQHAGAGFGILGNADAPVVNLDWFPEVKVVVNQSLFAAADDEVPHLDRAQPVDMKGSEQAVAEIQVEVSHVFLVGPGMTASHGRHAAGQAAQQKIDNGQIVRGQVPEHVDIVLQQAEVDADAVDIKDVAQLTGIDDLLDAPNRGTVNEGVVHHEG